MSTPVQNASLEPTFLLRMAHELRGPAGIIQGSLTELEAALGQEAEQYQKLFAMARRGVARVTRTAALLEQTGRLAAGSAAEPARDEPDRTEVLAATRPRNADGTRILVVEDDDDSAALLVCLFEREGWRVDTVSSLAEARRAFARTDYAVLVTDLNLPDGSGLSLLEAARPRALHAALLVTGALDEPQRKRSEALGFQGCLCKPLSGTDIVDAIRAVIPRGEPPR